METMATLLNGRSPLRCECGADLFAEAIELPNGNSAGRFIPCKCSSESTIFVPEGSIMATMAPAGPWQVWGPATGEARRL